MQQKTTGKKTVVDGLANANTNVLCTCVFRTKSTQAKIVRAHRKGTSKYWWEVSRQECPAFLLTVATVYLPPTGAETHIMTIRGGCGPFREGNQVGRVIASCCCWREKDRRAPTYSYQLYVVAPLVGSCHCSQEIRNSSRLHLNVEATNQASLSIYLTTITSK